ncbi:hypothetical protein HDV01_007247 [Terramyces sp. JEL0728]|nr:hypothetical protein HDV01_007247 [Terramyces sp. JEL0728]
MTQTDSIQNYELIKIIGTGSFAKVFLAKKDSKVVAIKAVSKRDEHACSLVEKSTQILTLLNKQNQTEDKDAYYGKQNVVKFYERVENSEVIGLVLEHIQGMEMFDYIIKYHQKMYGESIGIPEHLAKKIIRDLIQAVYFIHSHRIVHGDLKLENVIVMDLPVPMIKLIDFGLAQYVPAGVTDLPIKSSQPYLSPECIMQQPTDPFKADVWACGVVLFSLVTSRMPFDPDNHLLKQLHEDDTDESGYLHSRLTRSLMRRIAVGTYNFRASESDSLSPEVVDLISQMLTRDPKNRIDPKQALRHPWFNSIRN